MFNLMPTDLTQSTTYSGADRPSFNPPKRKSTLACMVMITSQVQYTPYTIDPASTDPLSASRCFTLLFCAGDFSHPVEPPVGVELQRPLGFQNRIQGAFLR